MNHSDFCWRSQKASKGPQGAATILLILQVCGGESLFFFFRKFKRVTSTPDHDTFESIAIQLPFVLRYFCKSMPFCWLEVYAPICMAYTSHSHLHHDTLQKHRGQGSLGRPPDMMVKIVTPAAAAAAKRTSATGKR